MVKSSIVALLCLSSGICDSPFSFTVLGVLFSRFSPKIEYAPLSTFLRPARASISSVCPLPSTPAIPKTSPSLISKETSFTFSIPFSPLTVISFTFTAVSPNFTSGFFTSKRTTLPTIIFAIFSFVASDVFRFPTSFPFLMTVILSDNSRTSCNL